MAPLHTASTTPTRRTCSTRPDTNVRCSYGRSTRQTSSRCFVSWLSLGSEGSSDKAGGTRIPGALLADRDTLMTLLHGFALTLFPARVAIVCLGTGAGLLLPVLRLSDSRAFDLEPSR